MKRMALPLILALALYAPMANATLLPLPNVLSPFFPGHYVPEEWDDCIRIPNPIPLKKIPHIRIF